MQVDIDTAITRYAVPFARARAKLRDFDMIFAILTLRVLNGRSQDVWPSIVITCTKFEANPVINAQMTLR